MKRNKTNYRINIDSLSNKKIVFTGSLQTMSRSQAQDLVKGLQGIAQSSVSKETDILVSGIKKSTIFDEESLSKKEEQAVQLIKEGFEIDLISEEQFLKLAIQHLTRLVSNTV